MEVKIPELGFRDFPTPLFVDATDASNMNPGQSYLVKLVQGSLKKDKDPESSLSYFWNYSGFANPEDVQVQPAAPAAKAAASVPTAATSAAAGQQWVDTKNQSIERQVAAKCATDLYIKQLETSVAADWDSNFNLVLDRIQNGPFVPEQETVEELPMYNAEGELVYPGQEVQ
jgi:hypothetical protein